MEPKNKLVAGLLAIFLGGLGIQYFYCGKTTAGIIAILVSLISCGAAGIFWLIQGIYMITMEQSEFDAKFVNTPKTMPLI